MSLNLHFVARILSILWLIFAFYWLVHAFSNKKTIRRQSRRARLLYVLIPAFLAYVLLGIPALERRLLPTTLGSQLVGILLTGAGIAVAIWARRILGGNWSGIVTLKQNHELIRRGPYRLVRHPIYSALLLAGAGSLLALLPTYQSLAFLLLMALVLRLKSLHEEKFLTDQFPIEYPQYKKSTKALIPFIY